MGTNSRSYSRAFALPLFRGLRALAVAAAVVSCGRAGHYYEQTYLPASHNWAFRHGYPEADRLFNAFDYGHAILYETLRAKPNAPPSELETKQFDYITKHLLVHPPAVPLEESPIGPTYVRLVPEVREIFEWAHLLHRQLYDVWADERIPIGQKDARVAQVLRYYESRRAVALSARPKSMELMAGQLYSLDFRKRYPKFNGLIWSYHWFQMAIYDALMAGGNSDERHANVRAAVEHFRHLLDDPPSRLPAVMPMSAAVAPVFAARYPEAAIIFDNLHSLHDVVSDILASPLVAPERKRAEILKAAAMYRDSTSYVTSMDEWREMSHMMDAGQMGGVADDLFSRPHAASR